MNCHPKGKTAKKSEYEMWNFCSLHAEDGRTLHTKPSRLTDVTQWAVGQLHLPLASGNVKMTLALMLALMAGLQMTLRTF
jgi:hypothetical protein